jgi:hypothetical protein
LQDYFPQALTLAGTDLASSLVPWMNAPWERGRQDARTTVAQLPR